MASQEITFPLAAGLDMDSDFGSVQGWRFAIGCRHGTSEEGNIGVIENPKGNTLVSYTLPAGDNQVIGSCKDIENMAIIWMVWNSNNNHQILRYFIQSNTIESCFNVIYTDTSELNFDPDFPIYTARLVYYETGELLVYTDRNNEIREINITRAIAGEYDAIDEQTINLIKRPPVTMPAVVYGNDSDVLTNQLRGKLWQFRYAYLYEDNQQSVYSKISEVPLPPGEDTVDGPYLYSDVDLNNKIDITLNTGHQTVKKLLVAVRQGNTGNWFLADILDKEEESWGDDQSVTYTFYNDKDLKPLSSQDSDTLFHYVPPKAGLLEYTSPNQLVVCDYPDGLDLPKPDVTVEYEEREVDELDSSHLWKFSAFYTATNQVQEDIFWSAIGVPNLINVPDVKHADIDVGTLIYFDVSMFNNTSPPPVLALGPIGYFHKITSDDLTNWPSDFLDNIVAEMNTNITTPGLLGPELTAFLHGAPYTVNGHTFETIDYSATTGWNVYFTNLQVVNPITTATSWKKGSTPELGIVYYDKEGRTSSVLTSKKFKVYIPFLTQLHPGDDYEDHQHEAIQLNMTIDHDPPAYATRYSIVWRGPSLRKSVQFILRKFPLTTDGQMQWRIDPLLNYASQNAPTQVNYSYEVGDRMRFITARNRNIVNGYVDVEITSFDASEKTIKTKAIDSTNLGIGDFSLVEIYAVRKNSIEDSGVWFETGYDFEIENGFHLANGQDQTGSQPAIVELTRGDTYIKPRSYINDFAVLNPDYINPAFPGFEWAYPLESEPYSDFYSSEYYDQGRVNGVIDGAKQRWLTGGVRYGEKVFENTAINGLANFQPNSYVVMPNEHGRIYGLKQVGYVLKVVQQNKTTSIYLNRTSSFNPDGTEQIILTDSFFGTIRPPEEDYGTIFPGSVISNNRYLYFYDLNRGVFVRDAANGQEPISDQFVKTYFTRKSLALKNQNPANIKVYSAWDEQTGQVFVTFTDSSESPVPSESISFHEKSGRWKSFHLFYDADGRWPEWFESQGQNMVSFMDGQLYVHNKNELRNNYYGRQHTQQIQIVSAPDYGKVKLFTYLEIHSNKKWACPTKGDVRIPSADMYPNGMNSLLFESWFQGIEGVYSVGFRRDMDTPGTLNAFDGFTNGSYLRGYAILVKLTNTHSSPVLLRGAVIDSYISEKM